MPFDGTGFIAQSTFSQPAKPEILMLDQIIEMLSAGWCKGRLEEIKDGRVSYCLYAALNLCDHGSIYFLEDTEESGFCFNTLAAFRIHRKIVSTLHPIRSFFGIARENSGIFFNDSRTTTKTDVLRFLQKIRRKFAG